MKISDLIPYGHDNAIGRKELLIVAHRHFPNVNTDRQMRREIQRCRERGTVILYASNGGYYQPTNDDVQYIKRYIAAERTKAQTLFKETHFAEKLLDDIAVGRKVGEQV